MADVANWVKEITLTTGVGDITLGGAPAGFATFASAIPDGEVWYTIVDVFQRESGKGTLTAGGTVLQRTTVGSTIINGTYSNNPAPISLTGNATVYCGFSEEAYDEILADIASGAGQVNSIVQGDNVTVDNTDPVNPIISAASTTVVAGDNITVDATDPANPIVSLAETTVLAPGTSILSIADEGSYFVSGGTAGPAGVTDYFFTVKIAPGGYTLTTAKVAVGDGAQSGKIFQYTVSPVGIISGWDDISYESFQATRLKSAISTGTDILTLVDAGEYFVFNADVATSPTGAASDDFYVQIYEDDAAANIRVYTATLTTTGSADAGKIYTYVIDAGGNSGWVEIGAGGGPALGTAAFEDVTVSNTDTTIGRVLKQGDTAEFIGLGIDSAVFNGPRMEFLPGFTEFVNKIDHKYLTFEQEVETFAASHKFFTDGAERMFIRNNGRTGFGTSNPDAIVSISGGNAVGFNSGLSIGNPLSTRLKTYESAGGADYWTDLFSPVANQGYVLKIDGTNKIRISATNTTELGDLIPTFGANNIRIGQHGRANNAYNNALAAAGTFNVDVGEFSNLTGNFCGFLAVIQTSTADPTITTKATYSYFGTTTGITFTLIASNDGAGGPSAFALDNGGGTGNFIRLTNNSGGTVHASMSVFGTSGSI